MFSQFVGDERPKMLRKPAKDAKKPISIKCVITLSWLDLLFSLTMSHPGSSKSTGVDWEKYQQKFDDEFVASGAKDKIVQTTRERLNNSEWADEVQNRFEEYMKEKGLKPGDLTEYQMQEICRHLRDELRRIIPSEVKQGLLSLVSDFVDGQLHKVKREILS
uniref:Transcription and mRNA export factor ENY2 n=2 Tax=Bursaphelenchus xylophilus TaxID=6326 RepID=A0A1I7RL64_BURXY